MLRAILPTALACAACTPVCPEGDCRGDAGGITDRTDRTDGWDEPVGRGAVYVISRIQIAGETLGFDLDGRCLGEICIDNRLSALSTLLNGTIENAHVSGHGRTMIEIAGDESILTDDPRATLKSYEARDWVDPPFPGDDFDLANPACCQFYVTERSTIGEPPRARWRAAALIQDGHVRNVGPGALAFTLPLPVTIGARVLTLERAAFDAVRASELDATLLTILLAGGVPALELALTVNHACQGAVQDCRSPDETLLDYLVSRGVQPDLDLDGDGLETFAFDPEAGRVGACFDGCTEGCPHELPIAPEDVDRPWTCAFAAGVRDAYSITLVLAATRASVLGVR